MGKSRDYELAIKIAGEIEKSLPNSVKLAKKELASIAKEASATSATLSETFSKELKDAAPAFAGIETAGREAFEAVAAAATAAAASTAALIAMSVSVGSSYESAFAGVRKTTEATEMEYEELRQAIIEMSQEIPASADEIAAVVEAAGQLGIQKENLLDFSRVMIDLGESTNMTATEGASALAKFANITNMSAENYSNLGSVIVALGNNFATTEADIVEMATRLAASGELVGLSQAQIMALSTAMSSVGIEAEAGGSAMSKLLKNIQVATELGGASLQEYASVAGMSAAEFTSAFGEDALGATSAFIAGLNDTERNGKSAIAILDEMGLTETRLSNTILSLANANGVMSEAVATANTAWEENVALSNEAAQRYATTESQAAMLKNRVTAIGIELYDKMREPLREIIAITSDVVSEIGGMITESGAFADAAENFGKKLPTAVRNVKQFGAALQDFSEPFLAVGGWLADNPGLLVGTITSVGTALATYKVASGVMSLASALGALGPVGWTILGIAGVVGVIAGIGTAVKKSAAEAKKANLAAHFGNIALSMEDLNKAAESIIASGSLTQVRRAMEEFDKLDGIQDSIEDLSSEIARTNWEISIGMILDEEDMESYRSNISSYVEQCQAYVEQQQYAVNLAVGVLTDDDLEGQNIVDQVNSFYAGKQSELSALGTELNNAITEAFQDGLLDMDEAQRIADIQAQMAEIQAQLAGTNFEAEMETLSMKYGGELDADSFMNLQAELAEKVEAAKADYEEAFTSAAASALAMKNDGAIDQAEYDSMLAEYRENYLEQVGDIELKAANFQMDTIMQQYEDELEAASPQMQQIMDEAFSNEFAWENNPLQAFTTLQDALINGDVLDKDTKAAMAELYEQMAPSIEQMEELAAQYREAGEEIPKELMEGINNASIIGTLAGDEDSFWNYIGSQINSNEDYQAILDTIKENGGEIPEELAESLDENQHVAAEAVQNLYKETDEIIRNSFSAGFETDAIVRINMIPEVTGTVTSGETAQKATLGSIASSNLIGGHATGGIFDTPHIAWFAENGPEAVIPLDASQNAIDLWEETGKLLGINGFGEESGESFSSLARDVESAPVSGGAEISYSPTLQFYGEAPSRKDLDEAFEMSEERFERMMEQYIRNHARLGFA